MSERPQDRYQTLEDALHQALRPVPPPTGFAERVLARAAEQERESAEASVNGVAQADAPAPFRIGGFLPAWLQAIRPWRGGWAVALGSLVLLLAAVAWYQHALDKRQAELLAQQEARQKALYALRLTGEKLAPARRALAELGIELAPHSAGEALEGSSSP